MALPAHGGGSSSGYKIPTTGPVTPKEIYYLLLQSGYSTNQAVGIMANMINESSLNPEAVGAGSYGLVQFQNGSYNTKGLVTGNAQKDARTQINQLAKVYPPSKFGPSSSPSEAAGTFAARFEKCAGCQQGQQQWNGRVGNAGTVAAWLRSGKWPTQGVTGGANNPGGGTPAGQTGPTQTGTCLISSPFALFSSGCLFSKTNARALIGGVLITGGGLITFIALGVVVAGAFSKTKVGKAAGEAAGVAASVVPGGAAVKGAAKLGKGRRAAKATQERKQMRAMGEPRENPNLRTGRGAIRETGPERARRMASATKNGSREKVPY